MSKEKRLDIVKGAILLEYKGKALYESVVQTTRIKEVKELFNMLVKEEKKHINMLKKQYSSLLKGKKIDLGNLEKISSIVADSVISSDIVNNVFGAGYESAVISAALEFEKNAVNYYSEHAVAVQSNKDSKLYQWLADWEKTHMQILAKVDNEIKEQIWYDNQFWPLD